MTYGPGQYVNELTYITNDAPGPANFPAEPGAFAQVGPKCAPFHHRCRA